MFAAKADKAKARVIDKARENFIAVDGATVKGYLGAVRAGGGVSF